MITEQAIRDKAASAVRHFWKCRATQKKEQGTKRGVKDTGSRSAVTGGKQLDGFVQAVASIIQDTGATETSIFTGSRGATNLPGYFRAEKNWDLLVVGDGRLLACVEFKSQVGSFGNNFNNRCEESIGNAHDFWTAYREGAFKGPLRPWLGYLMLLEDAPAARCPVNVREPHFKVFPEFRGASYATRYQLLMRRLLRERLYDGAGFLMSNRKDGAKGIYIEPDPEIGFVTFARSLHAHVAAHVAG